MEKLQELVVAPWRIIYRMFEDRVFVLAVLDSHRDIDDALLNRFVEPLKIAEKSNGGRLLRR